MVEQVVKATPIKSSDRLSFTIFIAVIVHLVLVLGVVFEYELNKPPVLTEMEVIFIQNSTSSEESDADYLAQVTQQGGGNTEEKVRPTSPPPSELPSDNPNEAPAPQVERVASNPEPTQQQLAVRVAQQAELIEQQVRELESKLQQNLTAQQLIQRSREIASLNAEVSEAWESYSKMPRKKYISAATQEYSAAAYMSAWQDKVERIGNINYPEAARHQNIYGSLVLEVNIKPDGSVQEINVLRSSGERLLDDAAIRIVRLASPFAPLPDALREGADILAIIRTWQFQQGGLATK
ncbi:MAG: TonB family protein [Gammaproteobacteria bacterium]|nr:TonB family protein [Gammaproteobacteria bacterium]